MSERTIWIGNYNGLLTKIIYWSGSDIVFGVCVAQWKGGLWPDAGGWFFTKDVSVSDILPNLIARGG